MKLNLYRVVGLFLLGVMFYGCEPTEEPLVENEVNAVITVDDQTTGTIQVQEYPQYLLDQLAAYNYAKLNTYELKFLERKINGSPGSETTTFRYLVSGTGKLPQLDSFTLTLPLCAGKPVSWTPARAATVSEGSIKWNFSVSTNGSQEYSITFPGKVPLGLISSTVTRGSNVDSYDILGPCGGVYYIAGSVFIDADNPGVKDPSELGLGNIEVILKNEKGEVLHNKFTSNSNEGNVRDGYYSFPVLKGTYSVSVANNLLDDKNYSPTTLTSLSFLNLSQDSFGNNFGFTIQTQNLADDFEAGKYNLNTEPTRFWIQEIKNAGKGNAQYDVKAINKILADVEALLLDNPFQLGTDKRAGALEILTRPIKSDRDEYLQQLLTAELNVVTGRGARDANGNLNNAFNRGMLIYAEAVGCRELGSCPASDTSATATKTQTKAVSSGDKRMLLSFNGSGGI